MKAKQTVTQENELEVVLISERTKLVGDKARWTGKDDLLCGISEQNEATITQVDSRLRPQIS